MNDNDDNDIIIHYQKKLAQLLQPSQSPPVDQLHDQPTAPKDWTPWLHRHQTGSRHLEEKDPSLQGPGPRPGHEMSGLTREWLFSKWKSYR